MKRTNRIIGDDNSIFYVQLYPSNTVLFYVHLVSRSLIALGILCLIIAIILSFNDYYSGLFFLTMLGSALSLFTLSVLFMALEVLCRAACRLLPDDEEKNIKETDLRRNHEQRPAI